MNGMQALLDSLDRQLRRDSGISHDDYRILSTLYRAPGRTSRMKHLADVMSYSPSRLTHAVSRMERQGWVARSSAVDDRRGVEVVLTEAGVAKAKDASRGHLELVRRLVFDAPVAGTLPGACQRVRSHFHQFGGGPINLRCQGR